MHFTCPAGICALKEKKNPAGRRALEKEGLPPMNGFHPHPKANSLSFAPLSPTDGWAGSRRADAEGPRAWRVAWLAAAQVREKMPMASSSPAPSPPCVAEQELPVACRTTVWDWDTEATSKNGASTDQGTEN